MIFQELLVNQGNPSVNTKAWALAMFTLLIVNFKNALFTVETATLPANIIAVTNLYNAIDQGFVYHLPRVETHVIQNYYTQLYDQGYPVLQQMNRLIEICPRTFRRLTNLEHMQLIHLMLGEVYTTLVQYADIFIVLIIKGSNFFTSQMPELLVIFEKLYNSIRITCENLIVIIRIVEARLGPFNINSLGITTAPHYPFFEP